MAFKRTKKTRHQDNGLERKGCAKDFAGLPTGVLVDRLAQSSNHYDYGIPGCLQDISIIIPTFQENVENLEKLVHQLRRYEAEVVVVDDGSLTDVFPDSIKHGTNFGYGAAIMTGIKNCHRNTVMVMDGDGQHSLNDALRLASAWKLMKVDMLIGARSIGKESLLRIFGRKFLNWTASLICTYWLRDLNSGMRIFKKSIVTGYIPILCKTFSFTTSLTLSMLLDGYKVEWFPINVQQRPHGKSRVKVIKDGWVTLYYILKIGFALRTRKIRSVWRKLKSSLRGSVASSGAI